MKREPSSALSGTFSHALEAREKAIGAERRDLRLLPFVLHKWEKVAEGRMRALGQSRRTET